MITFFEEEINDQTVGDILSSLAIMGFDDRFIEFVGYGARLSDQNIEVLMTEYYPRTKIILLQYFDEIGEESHIKTYIWMRTISSPEPFPVRPSLRSTSSVRQRTRQLPSRPYIPYDTR